MARYIARRVLLGLLMILALSVVTYAIFFSVPADPGYFLTGWPTTPAKLAAADRQLGVDHPVYIQYLHFLQKLVTGHLGRSYQTGLPVTTMIRNALPATAAIVVGGAFLTVIAAVFLGTLSALRPHTLLDRSLNTLIMAGVALHPLLVGLILQHVFVYAIPIAPSGGYCPVIGAGSCSISGWAARLALPWLTFMLYLLPIYARVIRTRVLEVLDDAHVVTARAKGASDRRIMRVHVLPLLVPTVATMVAIDMSTALMSAIYIEAAFTIPGLGTMALQSQKGFLGIDLPVIVGVMMVVAVAVIVCNVVADIVAARADPRIAVGQAIDS